ncbi:PHB depolymerase family esterase [Sphingomonas sp. AP4-R1]|uniref:extracellular catalytic domain type 1 short-chain-length polyhydroxyalkanoate depolymerase n=1 Tax=Sphingomonas sp. AP4-R1 TaxID=2735134 RepID=UPI0014935432|nr:PHB depolymerase family esterase [Sphingomonas sp. AP4-R1]QJU60234.1 PHB depolymerase family esterase [Sphingomonas sp. AP4-R1]
MRNTFFDNIGRGASATTPVNRLANLTVFGTNPGALCGRVYVPAQLAECPALVVVLHGCTQTAAGYDHGSGWSQLAERYGFVLLYPEQDRSNNANLCFNWFEPGDIARDKGEALSIRQMIEAMVVAHGIDRDRIFVTGLSAGGAMTSVMLATYPETFAGGAIIAGLPYGCASNIQEAFGAMRARGQGRPDALAALVRRASGHDGRWPSISVWHGTGDATVNPGNAEAIIEQWLPLHGVSSPPSTDIVDGYPHRAWRNASGRIVVEAYSITGMGHGTPLDTGGADPSGVAGPYMLNVAISSSQRIAEFWGLTANTMTRPEAAEQERDTPAIAGTSIVRRATKAQRIYPDPKPAPGINVRRIIEDALRAGGLMK